MRQYIDLTGRKFGNLTVLGSNDGCHWVCRCKCGNKVIVTTSRLERKYVVSCGCMRDREKTNGNKEFAKRVRGEWTRQWGKYETPYKFNIAVTEMHYGR